MGLPLGLWTSSARHPSESTIRCLQLSLRAAAQAPSWWLAVLALHEREKLSINARVTQCNLSWIQNGLYSRACIYFSWSRIYLLHNTTVKQSAVVCIFLRWKPCAKRPAQKAAKWGWGKRRRCTESLMICGIWKCFSRESATFGFSCFGEVYWWKLMLVVFWKALLHSSILQK